MSDKTPALISCPKCESNKVMRVYIKIPLFFFSLFLIVLGFWAISPWNWLIGSIISYLGGFLFLATFIALFVPPLKAYMACESCEHFFTVTLETFKTWKSSGVKSK